MWMNRTSGVTVNEGSHGGSSRDPVQDFWHERRRWVGADLVLQLERLCGCGENGSDSVTRKGKGREDDRQISKEGISCWLSLDSVKRTTHKPLLPSNSRIPLPGHGTPRASNTNHTSPSPLYCQPFLLFFPSAKFLFVCLFTCTSSPA